MKRYIKVCRKCGNTFETDNPNQRECLFCLDKQMRKITQWGYEQGDKKTAHRFKRLLKKAWMRGKSLLIPAIRKYNPITTT